MFFTQLAESCSLQSHPLTCRNGRLQLVFQGGDEVVYVFLLFQVDTAGQCVEHFGQFFGF